MYIGTGPGPPCLASEFLHLLDIVPKWGLDCELQFDRGQIAEGFLADIIAVAGNPLENLNALEDVSFVMIGGTIVKRPGRPESLDALLIGNQQP